MFVSAVLSRTRPRSSGLDMKSERSDFGSAQRIVLKHFGGVPVLKFLQKLPLDFPHICL